MNNADKNTFKDNSWITIRRHNIVDTIQMKSLDELLPIEFGHNDVVNNDIEVLTKDGFKKLTCVIKKFVPEENTSIELNTVYGIPIESVGYASIPVDRKGKLGFSQLFDVKEGDRLVMAKRKGMFDERIPKYPAVTKEIAQEAIIDDITSIVRFVYAEYGYTIESAKAIAEINDLVTVEDYYKLKETFPISSYVEDGLVVRFKDGTKAPFNIHNLLEFVREGGYYLTHGRQMKDSKYPKCVLDIYFNERIPNIVMNNLPIFKYAFVDGAVTDIPRSIRHMWIHENELIFRDFVSIIRSLGYRSIVEERINIKNKNGDVVPHWALRLYNDTEVLKVRSERIKANAEIKRINMIPTNEYITTAVSSITKKNVETTLYTIPLDGLVVNGYIVG